MSAIKKIFKPILYFFLRLGSIFRTNFFSNFFIALGYFIKSEYEYNTTTAVLYKEDRFKLHEFLPNTLIDPTEQIHYFEFGVRWGQIINRWARNNKNANSVFAGFDTFTGIPEDWGTVKAGAYSNKGSIPPPEDDRVKFYAGLVQDTLPDYLTKVNRHDKLVIHLDFDIYNATLFALIQLIPYIKKGDIIILDEYFSITKNHHEYRAFKDYLSLHKISYTPKYKCRGGQYVLEVN